METATLSPEGQVTIPAHLREALHLQPGDPVHLAVEGERIILERAGPELPRAKLVMGAFGRLVLVAPPGAPEMTPERVKAIQEEDERAACWM